MRSSVRERREGVGEEERWRGRGGAEEEEGLGGWDQQQRQKAQEEKVEKGSETGELKIFIQYVTFRDGLGEKDYLDYFITMVEHSASESHIADIL